MRRLLGIAGVLLAMAGGGTGRTPTAVVTQAGAIAIGLPGELLEKREVREQLTSGLTTVFMVAGSAADGHHRYSGATRINIRYDLWEEKYLIAAVDPTGAEQTTTAASPAELARWWTQEQHLFVPPHPYEGQVDVELRITMVPFSAQEEADTRRWLSRTLSASGTAGNAGGEQSASALKVIVESSIRRRPLLVESWSIRAGRAVK